MFALVYALLCATVLLSTTYADDPEAYMSDVEMIRYWGYPVEEHDVTTADGYILTLFRIPHGRFAGKNASCHRPAVLFVHGAGAGSPEFISNPPESSAAYILADAGFDVFLLNHRGTTYGKRHVRMDTRENAFWQFTLDEFAKYDAPAAIDKALEVSGQRALYWIGHSQGTIVGLMAMAENPEYNSKVKSMFLVTPIASVGHATGPLRIAFWAFRIVKPLFDIYRLVLGSHEISSPMPMILRPISKMCTNIPILGPLVIYRIICRSVYHFTGGPSASTVNMTRLQVYAGHMPRGTSTWTYLHYAQIGSRMRVEHMDHNPAENARRYGQVSPPAYNYSRVAAPVYLFWSKNDFLAGEEEVRSLLQLLRKDVVKGNYEVAGYNHLDYAVATDIAEKVFDPIARIVQSRETNMCEQ